MHKELVIAPMVKDLSYRRYEISDLRKKESLIDSFYFPPKKSVGYKAEKVVEERRKRLQSYLRQVMKSRIYV